MFECLARGPPGTVLPNDGGLSLAEGDTFASGTLQIVRAVRRRAAFDENIGWEKRQISLLARVC